MNFEDLQKLWDNQPVGEVPLAGRQQLIDHIKADSREFDTIIRARDRRELRAGLIYSTVFTVFGLMPRGVAIIQWPFLLAAGCMLFVPLFMLGEKGLAAVRRPVKADDLIGGAREAHTHLCRQVWLLRNVGWWYLLPAQAAWWFFGLGILLNGPGWTDRRWLFTLILQMLWSGLLWRGTVKVYRLNQEAVRLELQPRLQKLDGLLTEWRTKESACG